MPLWLTILVIIALALVAYVIGRQRSVAVATASGRRNHSLPSYYGYYVAIWCGLPALGLVLLWVFFGAAIEKQLLIASLPDDIVNQAPERLGLYLNDVRNLAQGNIVSSTVTVALQDAADTYNHIHAVAHMVIGVLALVLAIGGLLYARRRIVPTLRARNVVERMVTLALVVCSTIAILTTIGIVLSLLFESLRFFARVSPIDFLFGLEWSPQTALRADQVASSGLFGAIPLFAGTLLIAAIAMCVAAPVGLLAAIYMSEYAHSKVRAVVKPVLEILAGIPTVVYGFFAALTVAPFFRSVVGQGLLGIQISSESALAAGLVMGIMIIPFVSSLADDVISAVPQAMREGSYGLGATQSETIKRVIFPAALPGIVGGLLLAVSRAIGETMIVVMAAGLAANLTVNPLEAVTTVTVQIVTLLIGDQEFDSAKTLAAFALGLVLFCVTLALNVVALHIVRKYREQYE